MQQEIIGLDNLKRNKMKKGILNLHSEGSQYLIVISNKKYSKLLAIQDYPQRKYYLKNEEVSEEKFITELDNIGSSERMYSEEDIKTLIDIINWYDENSDVCPNFEIPEIKKGVALIDWFVDFEEQFKKK
jgi:hypothetical protein